ncbi:MAG: ATP-binding protein [Clostridia bacterium]|jgi:predicted AAA+ superfamily ATPase|nr:ATP-binding protein [Clostridia bacterium]
MDQQIEKAFQSEWKVIVFTKVMEDPLVKMAAEILKEAAKPDRDNMRLEKMYYRFTAAFIPVAAAHSSAGKFAWPDYLLNKILSDENIFSLQAENIKYEDLAAPLKQMVQRDLAYLQALGSFSGQMLRGILAAEAADNTATEDLPDWEGLRQESAWPNRRPANEKKQQLLACFQGLADWSDGLEQLCRYYYDNGAGIFGEYHSFRWVHKPKGGALTGVKNADPIKLIQLYEYEREQNKIIQNTEQFLLGVPSNNVLLYGDRGTGKSSTVKALVNRYASRGLRLIELQKQDIADYPYVISYLAGRAQKFIIFIDDLSFSENEGQYREMKALLEGGVEVKPDNVLVYATSNRRHLVHEKHTDRDYTAVIKGEDDVRRMDTLQEKLSLADRFGIAVTFIAPDQKKFLAIVAKLAQERGLDIELEELHNSAIKWEMSFNERSGRTAKQFIDFLAGQLALKENKLP